MPDLKPKDLVGAVRKVLLAAEKGGGKPAFLTAYQILDRLPERTKRRLIRERGLGGKGTGHRYAAASVVSEAAQCVKGVIVAYLDVKEVMLTIDGQPVAPSPKVSGIFRLEKPARVIRPRREDPVTPATPPQQ